MTKNSIKKHKCTCGKATDEVEQEAQKRWLKRKTVTAKKESSDLDLSMSSSSDSEDSECDSDGKPKPPGLKKISRQVFKTLKEKQVTSNTICLSWLNPSQA